MAAVAAYQIVIWGGSIYTAAVNVAHLAYGDNVYAAHMAKGPQYFCSDTVLKARTFKEIAENDSFNNLLVGVVAIPTIAVVATASKALAAAGAVTAACYATYRLMQTVASIRHQEKA